MIEQTDIRIQYPASGKAGPMTTPILTITLNPTIDVFGAAKAVQPTHKVRLSNATYEPGGGGINVARVITTLGGKAEAAFLAGGEMGKFLERLVGEEGIRQHPLAITGQTRVALMVRDESTGLEYRFLPDGPEVTAADIERCAAAISATRSGIVVASGSLPRGAPVDSYARLARAAARNALPFVLDTSGEALRAALEEGGILLVKPSRSELESLAGGRLEEAALEAAARALADAGKAQLVAVTLGADGAMLVSAGEILRQPAITVPVLSAVGAGDSFLGAMVWAMSERWPHADAFRLAMAAGAAATSNPGTTLCRKEDVFRLYAL
jgi:6-phosphofructokinase 2